MCQGVQGTETHIRLSVVALLVRSPTLCNLQPSWVVPLVVPTDSITLLRYGEKIFRENAIQLDNVPMRFPAADSAQLIVFPSRNEVGPCV